MTEQKIDRERRAMWRQVATDAGDDPYVNTLHPDEVLALLDQLEQAEADRDWNLRSSRLAKEERIKANARAERAEARIKAVEDVLDAEEARPRPIGGGYDKRAMVRIADIHRALEG